MVGKEFCSTAIEVLGWYMVLRSAEHKLNTNSTQIEIKSRKSAWGPRLTGLGGEAAHHNPDSCVGNGAEIWIFRGGPSEK